MLRITEMSNSDGTVTLRVEGKVAAEWSSALEVECLRYPWPQTALVLDFSAVTDIDSRGAGVVRRLEAGGVRLVHCSQLIGDCIRNHTGQ